MSNRFSGGSVYRFRFGGVYRNTVDGCEIHSAPWEKNMVETVMLLGITWEWNHSRVF